MAWPANTRPELKEALPRLFEKFFRVDNSDRREIRGTGLGLAIVKHIAQHHGGQLRIESSLGHGSVFTLVLPVARLVAESSGEAAHDRLTAPATGT